MPSYYRIRTHVRKIGTVDFPVQQHISPIARALTPVRRRLSPASDTNPRIARNSNPENTHRTSIAHWRASAKAHASLCIKATGRPARAGTIEVASTKGGHQAFTEVLGIAYPSVNLLRRQGSTDATWTLHHRRPSPHTSTSAQSEAPSRRSGDQAKSDC